MTKTKDWFTSLDESIKSKVKFIDDHALVVEDIGKIVIKMKNDSQAYIYS